MFEKVVLVINACSAFLVVLPLVLLLNNYRLVVNNLKYLSIYLIAAFLTELTSLISFYIFNYALTNSGLVFTLFEVSVVCLMLANWNKPKLKIYNGISLGYIIVWLVCVFAYNQPLYNLIFGLAGVFLIMVLIHFLFDSLARGIDSWMIIIVLAFLSYEILSTTIFAFMQFFIQQKHSEYISSYYLIHSLANASLYLLLSYGITKCKKQLLQAS